MKTKTIFSLQLLLCAALSVHNVHSFVEADSGEITFTGAVTATAFHKKSGKWIIGKTTDEGDDERLIVYTDAANGTDTQTLSTCITDATNGNSVNLLAVTENPDDATDLRIVYVKSNTAQTLSANALSDKTATADDTEVPKDVNNNATRQIHAIAVTPSKVFSAVDKTDANFGLAGSGIATTLLDVDNNGVTTLTNGANGSTFEIVNTIAAIKGAAEVGAEPTLVEAATLHWCSGLSRLYLGLQGAAANHAEGAIRTVLVFKENNDGLTSVPLLTAHTTALLDATEGAAGDSNGVGASKTNAARDYAAIRLNTMHTSTGHYYLIMQGGIGTATTASNKIMALPLVDADGDVPGALALVTSLTVGTTNFKKQATSNGEIFLETSTPAVVGGAVLPVAAASGVVTQMMVVGDTVYCATQATPGANDEPGLYYSQAIFNADGSIASWTGWAKAIPNNASGASATDGSCFAFAVDAITGKIWTIANGEKTEVRVTQWVRDTDTTTFGGSVNALLNGPCYSALNLGKHIVNFGDTVKSQFALFGGDSKVIFIKTSTTKTSDYASIENPTTDWTSNTAKATDYSTGLKDAGPITALGWTNQNAGTADNYFLAGTNKGLYVSVLPNDAGMIIENDDSHNTNDQRFTTATWKAVEAITDPVVKIVSMTVSTDPYIFVLTHGAQHKIWRITATGNTTLDDLNDKSGEALTADLISSTDADADSFYYDIDVIKTTNLNTLIVATSTGLYTIDNIADAIANIAITRLELGAETNHIRSLSTPLRTRVNQNLNYVRTTLRNAGNGKWTPAIFSSLGSINFSNDGEQYSHIVSGDRIAADNSVIGLANPIKKFYTDGARRFYIEAKNGNAHHACTLRALPFYNGKDDYNVSVPATFADKAITDSKTIYWINEMGAGYLMAGTDNGVIALQ